MSICLIKLKNFGLFWSGRAKRMFLAAGLGLVVLGFAASPAPAGELVLDVYKPDKVFAGTTVFVDTIDPTRPVIKEIDMQGRIVWEYVIPTKIVSGGWPSRAADVEWLPQKDHFLFVMPYRGVYEVNRAKQIVWKHETPKISHDCDRLANGNTLYAWAWDTKDDAQVTEIDPAGRVVWQWFAARHLPERWRRRHPGSIDDQGYCHTNGAVRLPNGHTMISMRNFGTLVEVDQAGDIVWHARRLKLVHSPDPLPNGNILLSTHAPQKMLQITRRREVVWEFERDDVATVRYNKMLPGGNIFFAERTKLMEITQDKEIVWQVRKKDVEWDFDERNRMDVERYRRDNQPVPKEQWFYTACRIPAKR